MASPLALAFFDLETSPLLTHVWRAHENYVAPERLKHDTFLLSWALKFSGSPVVYSGRLTSNEAWQRDDRRLVREIMSLLSQADYVVAHNGDNFDIPILNSRLFLHNEPPLGQVDTIDTLKLARRSFKLASNKLDYLASMLGLEGKHETGFELWERCYQGDPEALLQMDRYCRNDVRLLERVFERIKPYAKGLPRLLEPHEKGEVCCIYCGSYDLQRRGTRKTAAGTYPRYQCNECGRWTKGSKAEPQSFHLRPS